jgi:DICT domain-containing protein
VPTPDTPRTLAERTSPAGLSDLALTNDLRPGRLRIHSRSIMIALSHQIEAHAAAAGESVLIACFQRLSLLLPEAERYRALAPRLSRVYVLGVPDVPAPDIPGVTVIPLEASWPLAQEWNVIGSGPTFCAALLARDVEGFRLDRRSRRFEGLWTAEQRAVNAALRAFFDTIGEPCPPLDRDAAATTRSTRAIQAALAKRF